MQVISRWNSKISVGAPVIDNQHKVMFDLIHDLDNAIRTGASIRVVDVLLGVFRDYAFQHFQTEEDYFRLHSDFAQHCLEHYALIKRLNVFILDFRNNRIKKEKLPSMFLEDWLFDHIEHFDIPFFTNNATIAPLSIEEEEIEQFEPDIEQRRLHKRIPHTEVVDGDILAHVYNATKLQSCKAKIVNMSPGGLMVRCLSHHAIDDLLIVSCNIGKRFKMEEKVKVKTAQDRMYGVQFVSPSADTIDFFTKLYGSVHLNRAKSDL